MADGASDVYEIMRHSDLFDKLNSKSIASIAMRMKRAQYASDEIICREGEPGNRMYIIVEGEIAVQKDLGWGQRELERMGAGEVFGEMALLSKEKRSATIVATVATECLQLDEFDFDELLDQDSHFAQRVAQMLTNRLRDLGQESSKDLMNAYRALIFSLAGLAESRDPETGAHLERTRGYCTLLADLLSKHPKYSETIKPAFIDAINYISPLHDIGKVAIPDSILLKPGKLTDREFDVMKTHTTSGALALQRVLEQSNQDIFQMAYRICLHHHERWNGAGYPLGFSGDDIPLEARIMSIADVFDALLSKRVYKQAYTYDDTRWEINGASGTQFDPTMTVTFIENFDDFVAIHKEYADE